MFDVTLMQDVAQVVVQDVGVEAADLHLVLEEVRDQRFRDQKD